MSNINLDLSKLSAIELVSRSEFLETNVDGNSNFPEPTPAIAEIAAKRLELQEWILKCEYGDRRAIQTRNDRRDELMELIRQLAAYVRLTAKGDAEVIRSSGFALRKTPEPITRIGNPQSMKASPTNITGVVELSWKRVYGSKSYIVEMTTEDPTKGAVWEQKVVVTKSRCEIKGLEPGKFKWFRTKAIGSHAESGYSKPALVMVI